MRPAAGAQQIRSGIGVGCGLFAGVAGIAQWVLTARDLTESEAAFDALARRCGCLVDATNLVKGYEWDWIGMAAVAGVVASVFCLLAAFAAGWVSADRLNGAVAAWVATALSSAIYVVATLVALRTSPAPDITRSVVPCVLPLGLTYDVIIALLAPVGAGMGVQASRFFSRDRRAS